MGAASSLRFYMNLLALNSLPDTSTGPRGAFGDRMRAVRTAGFDGVQFAEEPTDVQLATCRELKLGIAGSGRINTPQEAGDVAKRARDAGLECLTLHVGWGLESDAEASRLLEGILEASDRHSLPLYVETHRATICQDMWRTVQLTLRFPEMRFNGDFSHWYTGQEMVYGSFERKLSFIQPVLERVCFLHGRIANPGCIQVPIDSGPAQPVYVEHFKMLWTSCFRHFRTRAAPGEFICFTPELLGPDIYYARSFKDRDGSTKEESDRWQQSLLLNRVAAECFEAARNHIPG